MYQILGSVYARCVHHASSEFLGSIKNPFVTDYGWVAIKTQVFKKLSTRQKDLLFTNLYLNYVCVFLLTLLFYGIVDREFSDPIV